MSKSTNTDDKRVVVLTTTGTDKRVLDSTRDIVSVNKKVKTDTKYEKTSFLIDVYACDRELGFMTNVIGYDDIITMMNSFEKNNGRLGLPVYFVMLNICRYKHGRGLIMIPLNVFRQLSFYASLGVKEKFLDEYIKPPFRIVEENSYNIYEKVSSVKGDEVHDFLGKTKFRPSMTAEFVEVIIKCNDSFSEPGFEFFTFHRGVVDTTKLYFDKWMGTVDHHTTSDRWLLYISDRASLVTSFVHGHFE